MKLQRDISLNDLMDEEENDDKIKEIHNLKKELQQYRLAILTKTKELEASGSKIESYNKDK